MQTAAAEAGVSEEGWKQFVAYVAAFYGNMSNYHSFGDMKFVPELAPEDFKAILLANPLYQDEDAVYKEVIDELFP